MPTLDEIKTQAELDKVIANAVKEGSATAVASALARSGKKTVSKADYDKLQTELLETQATLTETRTLPAIKAKFKELGGKDGALDDYLTKHKQSLMDADPKRYEKLIKDTIKETQWAFEEINHDPDTPDFDNTDDGGSLLA